MYQINFATAELLKPVTSSVVPAKVDVYRNAASAIALPLGGFSP